MRRFYAYIRVSTHRQGVHGVSLQEQRDAIRRYADQHELSVTDWFEEQETAATRGRSQFARLLSGLQKGHAEGVLIHKVDRGARNLRDWADLGALIDRGIEVRLVSESLDLTSRGGRLSADIQAVVAADYIRNLKEEIRKGFYGRLRQGYYPLPAPAGYLDQGGGRAKTPDPDTAPLVRRAFELYGSGRYSLETLRHEMARRGLHRRGGRPYSKEGLASLLRNPFYCGVIRLRRTGETFDGNHPPLLSVALFDRVQRIMSGAAPRSPCTRHQFLFQRLLSCGRCNRTLVGELQKGHVYYRCHSPHCSVTGIREDRANRLLSDELRRIQLLDEEREELKTAFETLWSRRQEARQRDERALKKSRSKIEERLSRLTDAYVDGLLEKDVFEERREGLLLERRRLEERESQPSSHELKDRFNQFVEDAVNLGRMYDTAALENRRRLLARISSNRRFDGSTLDVTWRTPFHELANRGRSSDRPSIPSSNESRSSGNGSTAAHCPDPTSVATPSVSCGGACPSAGRTGRICARRDPNRVLHALAHRLIEGFADPGRHP